MSNSRNGVPKCRNNRGKPHEDDKPNVCSIIKSGGFGKAGGTNGNEIDLILDVG